MFLWTLLTFLDQMIKKERKMKKTLLVFGLAAIKACRADLSVPTLPPLGLKAKVELRKTRFRMATPRFT